MCSDLELTSSCRRPPRPLNHFQHPRSQTTKWKRIDFVSERVFSPPPPPPSSGWKTQRTHWMLNIYWLLLLLTAHCCSYRRCCFHAAPSIHRCPSQNSSKGLLMEIQQSAPLKSRRRINSAGKELKVKSWRRSRPARMTVIVLHSVTLQPNIMTA